MKPRLAALLHLLTGGAVAQESFPIAPPDAPIPIGRAAPVLPVWGQIGPIRLIYHVGMDQAFNDLDRRTIQRQVQLIKDFYLHFGLILTMEEAVRQVQFGDEKSKYDYNLFLGELRRRGLFVAGRTIVFNAFDVGRGGYNEMAYTSISDRNVYDYECGPEGNHSPSHNHPWWCSIPADTHWGGILHEVGHMLGLAHDQEIMKGRIPWVDGPRYLYCGGSIGPYASPQQMPFALMWTGYQNFAKDPRVGLLPAEVDFLCRKHAPEACAANSCGGSSPITAQTQFW